MNNGVGHYTRASATVPVFFANGICDCRHCSQIATNSVLKLAYCRLTGETIEHKELKERGQGCPVIFEEQVDKSENVVVYNAYDDSSFKEFMEE